MKVLRVNALLFSVNSVKLVQCESSCEFSSIKSALKIWSESCFKMTIYFIGDFIMTAALRYPNTASLDFLPAQLRLGGLEEQQVIKLLEEHIIDMYENSPEECVHTMNIHALQSETIKFWSAWRGDEAVGCVAMKYLSPYHCEIKSMRTSNKARGTGVGRQLLEHVAQYAKLNGVKRLSLETGTMDFFAPARKLYSQNGFEPCGPFGDYEVDPHSCFMTLIL